MNRKVSVELKVVFLKIIHSHKTSLCLHLQTPGWTKLLLSLILISFQIGYIRGNGQGPVGIHAIHDQYALIVDTSTISHIIVDLLLGGIVGILTFPTSLYSKETIKNGTDIHFIGVTTCDDCLYIHVNKMHYHYPHQYTESHLLEIGPLDRSLLKMTEDSNFLSFNSLSFEKDAISQYGHIQPNS